MIWETLSCRKPFDENRQNVEFAEIHPCLFMRITNDRGLRWVNGPCNVRASYICEKNSRKLHLLSVVYF